MTCRPAAAVVEQEELVVSEGAHSKCGAEQRNDEEHNADASRGSLGILRPRQRSGCNGCRRQHMLRRLSQPWMMRLGPMKMRGRP